MATRDTKSLLLDRGIVLMRKHAYHDTGIQDVLAAADVPKGSFYHFFKSKEDFGLQAVHRYAEAGYRSLDAHLSDQQYPPVERVRRFFAEVFEDWQRGACREGCLLGTLGQELADVNESFRHAVAASLDQWSVRIARCLREAQQRGELSSEIDPEEFARQLVDGFQGAALRMKLVQNPQPLEGFLKLYFDRLLAV